NSAQASANARQADGKGPVDAADPDAAMDRLVDVIVGQYAPLPMRSLSELVSHLRAAAPQWTQRRPAALARAKARLPSAEIDGRRWFWPADESPTSRRHAAPEEVRLLAPFDPVVWDRRRFELFWGWAYRFEAYTPAPKRIRGYYALPLLWRDQVIGWGNLSVRDGRLLVDLGYQSGKAPRERAFHRALDEELDRMQRFLGL
ncbi:MAG: DNA glycosylase AlkZ-like family protein, partial [Rubrivivax sp.]